MLTRHLFLFILFSAYHSLFAQKNVTLAACEEAFVKTNLLLLAEQYNIEASKAHVIQAKIWELPYAEVEFNAINPSDKRVFDVGSNGQKGLAIQQLIYLGKKKKNEVEFAKSNVALAEIQFAQLLHNLRYQLYQSYYSIYFDTQKIVSIDNQIANIDTLAKAYAVQAALNNVSLKDLVRLQSLSLSLKNDLLEIKKNINDEQEKLKTITGLTENITPTEDGARVDELLQKRNIASTETLLNTALSKNPDYLSYQKIIENQELLLKWQKSMSIPDMNAGIAYDQRGGAFNNQINFTVGIPIPLWNKNKGNVQVAEIQLRQANILREQKIAELRNSIQNAYYTWLQQSEQYRQLSENNLLNLDLVYSGILQNFQKRNIGLLEFTDFMESYSQTILQINEMKKQLVFSCETINFLVNDSVF